MTPLKTIIATAVIAVGGTVAAFAGLHIGQPSADAATAQAAKAMTTYTVSLTAKQLAKLMHGQNNGAAHKVRQQQRHAVRHQNTSSSSRNHNNSRTYSGSSRSYSGNSGYRCYGSGGSYSGGWGGSSRSGGGWGGGCW